MPRAKPKQTKKWGTLDDRIAAAEDYLNRTRARVNKILERAEVLQGRVDALKAKKESTSEVSAA